MTDCYTSAMARPLITVVGEREYECQPGTMREHSARGGREEHAYAFVQLKRAKGRKGKEERDGSYGSKSDGMVCPYGGAGWREGGGRRGGEEGRKGEAEGEGGRGQGGSGRKKKRPRAVWWAPVPPWIIIGFWVLARLRSRRRLLLVRCIHSPTIINHPFHPNHLCSHHGFLYSLL